jgi:hypothetical protein
LVSYGFNKTMQLDKEGQKAWKKPVKIEVDYEEDDLDEEADYATYTYDNGRLFLFENKLTFSPKKGSGFKAYSIQLKPETKLEYDEVRKTMVVYDNTAIFLVNPDKYPKSYLSKKTKTSAKELFFVEMRKDCYYFAGQEDFVIVKPEGEVIERHYKEPFDKKAFMTNTLGNAMSLGSVAYGVSGLTKSMKGSGELIMADSDAKEKQAEKDLKKGSNQLKTANALADASSFVPPGRHSAFSQSQDFAYFFTKDKKADEKVLVKVNKDSGEEVDKLILNDARPVYKADEVENRVFYADKKQLLVFEPKK